MIFIIIIYIIFSIKIIIFTYRNTLLSLPELPLNFNLNYHYIHILYLFLPLGLIGQFILINHIWWMIIITQFISLIIIILLYKYCKYLINKHLNYLRYSNMLISGFISLLIPIICLLKDYLMNIDSQKENAKQIFSDLQIYKDSLDIVLLCLFLLPFFYLQILYEKISISTEFTEKNITTGGNN